MSYFFDMVKEFVFREMKKENGTILEDTEFCFSCGLYLRFMELKGKKKEAKKIIEGLAKNKDMLLLKASICDLNLESQNMLMEHLFHLIQDYKPEGKEMDYVMEDVLKNAYKYDQLDSEIKKKTGQKTSNLVCKTYKLPKDIVEHFAETCKKEGVKMGPQLTSLMEAFIEASNK